MKKLVLLCVAAVCAFAFSFTGCDDSGLTCAEQCVKEYNECVSPLRAMSCSDEYSTCLTTTCGLTPE